MSLEIFNDQFRGDCLHKADNIKVAFTRHVPEMTGPIKQVHVDQRRVGKLDKEYLVAGNRADALGAEFAAKRVETVDDQAETYSLVQPDSTSYARTFLFGTMPES